MLKEEQVGVGDTESMMSPQAYGGTGQWAAGCRVSTE